ncbi:MAG: Chromosome partition protein Smc [Mycoplasmataceae bacterium]|nr:MAG: Chromosome partition protein Smc [Mycoplasmataceae bacterium]
MVLASEYLEENYPKNGVCVRKSEYNSRKNHEDYGKKRNQIWQLNLENKNLTGTLDLADFVNLEELNCSCNALTKIILPANNKIKRLTCNNNQLTSFDYSQLNPHTLTDLKLFNNNLESTNLEVFSPLVNLTSLEIGNGSNRIRQGEYSKIKTFYGSLESLKNCTKLNCLDIRNTNINTGLEYLTPDLEKFYCRSLPFFGFEVREIEEKLKPYGESDESKAIIKWRKANQKLIQKAREITNSISELTQKRIFLNQWYEAFQDLESDDEFDPYELANELRSWKSVSFGYTPQQFIQGINEHHEKMVNSLQKTQRDLQTANEKNIFLQDQKNHLEQNLNQSQQENSNLRKDLEGKRWELEKIQRFHNYLRVNYDNLQNEKAQIEKANQSLTQKTNSLQSELSNYQEQKTELTNQKSSLENQLKQSKRDYQKELKSIKEKKDDLKVQLDQANATNNLWENSYTNLQSQTQQKLKQKDEQISNLNNKINQTESKLTELKKERDKKNAEIYSRIKIIKSLEEEIKNKEQKLAETHEKLTKDIINIQTKSQNSLKVCDDEKNSHAETKKSLSIETDKLKILSDELESNKDLIIKLEGDKLTFANEANILRSVAKEVKKKTEEDLDIKKFNLEKKLNLIKDELAETKNHQQFELKQQEEKLKNVQEELERQNQVNSHLQVDKFGLEKEIYSTVVEKNNEILVILKQKFYLDKDNQALNNDIVSLKNLAENELTENRNSLRNTEWDLVSLEKLAEIYYQTTQQELKQSQQSHKQTQINLQETIVQLEEISLISDQQKKLN